jgi:hypothetical protein
MIETSNRTSVHNDRPITYTENGRVYYRASALGSCPRALYASRRSYEPEPYPENVRVAFREGHELEPVIEEAIEKQGFPTYDHQREVVFKVFQNTHVIGHIDCMVRVEVSTHSGGYVCDAKALSDSNYSQWLRYGFEKFPKWAWQLSAYAYGTGSSVIYMAVYNKESQELHISHHLPPYSFSQILERVLYVEQLVADKADLPECVPDLFYCPYSYLEDSLFDNVELSGGIDQYRQNELWAIADEYYKLKAQAKRIDNQAKDVLHKLECKLLDTDKSLRVKKTGARQPYSIIRVNGNRKEIDKELLGQYLQSLSRSLTDFEKKTPYSYIQVRKPKKGSDDSSESEQ